MAAPTMATAVGRWAGLGPYYAMFPTEFAFGVVEDLTGPGGAVLDPFAGRGASIYAAAASGRSGIGIEINPVGWLYGRVKLAPASKGRILNRLEQLGDIAVSADVQLPESTRDFFTLCYSPTVLRFLTTCRDALRWRESKVDATLMAIILVYLHGKRPASLSNQMRQGKAMSPAYSIRWWRKNRLRPPDLDPVEFLRKRIEWRYAKGIPDLPTGKVILGDSRAVLPRLSRRMAEGRMQRFDLLFTSPPYCGVTNYYADQWLRLWMLGGPARPTSGGEFARGRLYARRRYAELLKSVFDGCAPLLKQDATVYVRTDARPFTYGATLRTLGEAFPRKSVTVQSRPYSRQTQTALFGDNSPKPGEVDIILT